MAGDGLTAAVLNGWLNTLKGTAYTAAQAAYAQLHTGDPGSAGTANVSAGDTTRQALTFTTSAAESLALTSSPTAWTNGGTSETITNISLWTASTAGTFVGSVTLTASKAWAASDTLTLNTCTITLSPLAS